MLNMLEINPDKKSRELLKTDMEHRFKMDKNKNIQRKGNNEKMVHNGGEGRKKA